MNGLVDSGDEGRGKQRYASGSRKQALIRRFPNGATHPAKAGYLILNKIEMRSERGELKHLSSLRKRNRTEIPPVAASEKGTG